MHYQKGSGFMAKRAADKFKAQSVESVHEFLQAVNNKVKEWMPNGEYDPWFRGHMDGSWELLPGLYRLENEKLARFEKELRAEFRLRAWPYLAETAWKPEGDWDWYFLMQHYGIPTRLLDWTEGALTALYFSVCEPKHDTDRAVWMIDPRVLNMKHFKGGGVPNPIVNAHAVDPYLPPSAISSEIHRMPSRPLAIHPPHKSPRIAAQQGMFTVHGSKKTALEAIPELAKRCIKIEIPKSSVAKLREELRIAGIAETSVFPELQGLCNELVEFYHYSD